MKGACKSKPNQVPWLVVYYSSVRCAKLLSVGQWGFIACGRKRQLKRERDWRATESELKWPAQGKECHLLTRWGSTSFASPPKGCLPHLSVISEMRLLPPSPPLKGVQFSLLWRSSSLRFEGDPQFVFPHSWRTWWESIITSVYACFCKSFQ